MDPFRARVFTLEEEGRDLFQTRDARRILGTSEDSVKGVLKRLKRKGRIEELLGWRGT